MNVKKLLELAELLESEEQARLPYNQTRLFNLDVDGCPSCALARWMSARHGIRSYRDLPCPMSMWAMAEFDLTHDEHNRLFETYGCGSACSAAQAAAFIRGFVK